MKEHYECTIGILFGKEDFKEAKVPDSTICWQNDSDDSMIAHGADPRRVEITIADMTVVSSKVAASSALKPDEPKEEDNTELHIEDATMFRPIAARANYLAVDRPDAQYACKEISRGMAHPTSKDKLTLRRLIKYLAGRPRMVHMYGASKGGNALNVSIDADWASVRK